MNTGTLIVDSWDCAMMMDFLRCILPLLILLKGINSLIMVHTNQIQNPSPYTSPFRHRGTTMLNYIHYYTTIIIIICGYSFICSSNSSSHSIGVYSNCTISQLSTHRCPSFWCSSIPTFPSFPGNVPCIYYYYYDH